MTHADKRCSVCNMVLSAGAFSRNRNARDGLMAQCKACRKDSQRKYYQAHKETIKIKVAIWTANHADQKKERARKYREKHQKRIRENKREWQKAHPDSHRAASLKYRLNNPEKCYAASRNWDKRHPDRAREVQHKRNAIKKGALAEDVRLAVLVERDGGHCGICHEAVLPGERSIDHIKPLSKGGQHTYSNTRLTHLICNIRRGNRDN